jgi:hypothetical protein
MGFVEIREHTHLDEEIQCVSAAWAVRSQTDADACLEHGFHRGDTFGRFCIRPDAVRNCHDILHQQSDIDVCDMDEVGSDETLAQHSLVR